MSEYKMVWDLRLIWSIAQQVIIALIIGALIHVMAYVTSDISFAWSWITYLVGAAIWTLILCFTPAINMWFISPEANRIVVLANPFKAHKIVRGNDLTKLQDTRNMRAIIGPTFAGKSIFESVVQTINATRSVPLGETPVVAYTKNNIKVTIGFQAFLTPIPSEEGAVNLARHNSEYIKNRFMNEFRSYIIATVATMNDTDLLAEIFDDPSDTTKKITGVSKLKHGFNNLFGGGDGIVEIELQHGIFTGNPAIGDVIIDPDYQLAQQAVAAAKKTRLAIDELVKNNGVHPHIAANMVAASNKQQAPAQVREFIGVDGVKHLVVGDLNK